MMLLYGLLIGVVIFATLGWKLVPHGHVGITEKLGVFYEELPPGLYFRIPFVIQMRDIVKIEVQEVELDSIYLATKDDRNLELKASIKFVVKNPKLYVYETSKPYKEINSNIELVLANEILRTNYEDLGSVIETLNNLVLTSITEKLDTFGVKLERVSLKKIIK